MDAYLTQAETDRSLLSQDGARWAAHEQRLLKPIANQAERFAAMANRHGWLPAFYSFRVIRRCSALAICAVWEDHFMQHAVKGWREKDGPSVMCELEKLVERLR